MIGGITELTSKGPAMESTIEGGSASKKEIRIKGKTSKDEIEENLNDRNLRCQYLTVLIQIPAEVEGWEPIGLEQMIKLAQRVENREITQREASFMKTIEGKVQTTFPIQKSVILITMNENKPGNSYPMRTITLRGVTAGENRRERPGKRLSDAEFQAREDKGLCFRCDEKYHVGHRCKIKEQMELRMFVVR
ncbi:retrotransposon protein [Cucumis melo var. makuwa]|uniref:Retrotransposon protein n=1 Tax=Cucumis melo var. makuwa TaxID=1194695 RepID=A0A5D3C0H5_CUCMM|nr:retrotransposon protein [Cucumis melo var. makuwa]